MAGDKTALAEHLAAVGIDTPPCSLINPREGLPPDAAYPAVLKPNDGAGSFDTYFVESRESLPLSAREMPLAILQPYRQRPADERQLPGRWQRPGLAALHRRAGRRHQ